MHLEDTIVHDADHERCTYIKHLTPLCSFWMVLGVVIYLIDSSRAPKEWLHINLLIDLGIFSAIKHSILIFKNSTLILNKLLIQMVNFELSAIEKLTLSIMLIMHFLVWVHYLSHIIFWL